jgi:tetratricopeptide (TPR) repeat protein/tRNA A-37 threonylcarbamoyl transferase component Bud32
MSLLHAPQIGIQPERLSAADEQLLLAVPQAEDETDLFATDPDPNIRRLGRIALRRPSPQANDYFALGDLCAQRAYEGERLSILYVVKALQAFKRAARLARQATDQALAGVAQANLAAWAVTVAHNTPSANNISVALWAVAEIPAERLSAQVRAAALELIQWYSAALSANMPSNPEPSAQQPPSWLDSEAEELFEDESDEAGTEYGTSPALSESFNRIATSPTLDDDQGAPIVMGNGDDFKRGDVIGERYRVQNILEGGMGIIYVCLDEQTDSFVALKTFQARYLSDETAKRRFENEARLWVEMDKHPNIVRAYKVASFGKSRSRGRPHIILEYIDGAEGLGSDLRGWIRHKRLTPQLSLEIALDVCDGMLHAVTKKEGFVHRDLKPANILVRHDTVAKVTDFGLGRAFDSLVESQEMPLLSSEQLQRPSEARLTEAGRVMGTLAYMAPEQYTPRSLDARADIFAFGIILYEMLTGIRLFGSASNLQTLRELHSRPVSFPPALAEQLPADLCQLTLRCLQVPREARPQTWQELRTELAACYRALTGKQPPLKNSPTEMQLDELMDKAYSLSELRRYNDALAVYDQALALDPHSAWVWARKGRVLRQLKRYPEALETFAQALNRHPTFAWAWYNKGIVHERLGEYAQAQAAYQRAAELRPGDIWAAYNHARLLFALGQFEAAHTQIEEVLNIDPNHALSHALRGRILMRLGKTHEALAAFDRALQLDHELSEAFIGRGEALIALKRRSEAASAFLRATRLSPKQLTVWLRLADAYLANGNEAQALTALEQAERLRPESIGIWLRFGRIHRHYNRPEKALEAYERVLARQPQHVEALIGKSLALFALARHAEAIAPLQAALAQRPEDFKALSRLGIAYLRSGEAEQALSCFQRALARCGDQAWLWAKCAAALLLQQRHAEAVAAWQRALALKPDQAWYRTKLAEAQLALGQFEEALATLESADTPEALTRRATIFCRQKRYDEALAACDRALSLAPDLAWAHNERGKVLERLKRIPEALNAYEQALQCAPQVVWYRLNVLRSMQRLSRHEEALVICVEGLALPNADPRKGARLWAQQGEILRRLHRYTEALEAYAQARTLDSELPQAWAGAGLVYAALGRRAEALQAFREALERDRQNAWLWYNYGEVLIEDGNYPEAIRALNQALSLKHGYVKAELKRLEARQKLKANFRE